MKTILEIAKLVGDKMVTLYQEAGENEVNMSYCFRQSSVTLEMLYPKHVHKLLSELLAMSNQLKCEGHIADYKLSISSSRLKVSLFQ